MRKVAAELLKIARHLISYDRWKEKIVGKDFRLQHDEHTEIRLEELPAKGKKTLRIWSASIWSGGQFTIINPQNIIEHTGKVSTNDDYDQAKDKMVKAIEELKKTEVEKYKVDPKHMEYAVRVGEITVNALKVAPEGSEKIVVDGKDFKVTAEWTKFGAYDPQSNFQSMDPTYTKIESTSTAGARKFYRLVKSNPDALKNLSWDAFTDWLTKNGIKYDTHFSQYR